MYFPIPLQCAELGTESIPACVLQIYVLLTSGGQVGSGAVISILISAFTTGFTSAMIAFDMDVDVVHRKSQPAFYGYIPDAYDTRGRCFILMMFISILHNLSRSIGCALRAASLGNSTMLFCLSGETLLYLTYKIVRKDFLNWMKLEGFAGVLVSFLVRVLVKVIVDFCGCLHFR